MLSLPLLEQFRAQQARIESGLKAAESAASDGPLADYSTKGVENQRLSGGIAGVIGVGTTLVLGGGLFWLLRRRRTDETDGSDRVDAVGSSGPTAGARS